MASFPPLALASNDGWGPSCLPSKFSDIPFATFSKSERLGRVADWIQGPTQHGGRHQRDRGQPIQTPFAFRNNDEDDTFQLVDSKSQQLNKPKSFVQLRPRFAARGRGAPAQGRGGRSRRQADESTPHHMHQPRDTSITIDPEWEVLETFAFASLSKLTTEPPEPEQLEEIGKVPLYDKSCDRITCKTEKRLQKIENTPTFPPTASDDPMLVSYAANGKGHVFVTEAVLAALMTATRSVFSWDIVVTKTDGKIFIDKRRNSRFDNLTVNETSNSPPPEDKESSNNIDCHPSLSLEATFINRNFMLQATLASVKSNSYVTLSEKESPFEDSRAGGVRYLSYELEEGGLKIVCRCTVDAASKIKEKDEFLHIRALNEYDPKASGVDWRKQLDAQRGAVMATEIRNNNGKIARWCAASLIAGIDQLKIGYVSRVSTRDAYNHSILSTQMYKPADLASQIALHPNNMWGIVKHIIEVVQQYEDGKFLIVKDPIKTMLTLYAVPSDAFDEEQ